MGPGEDVPAFFGLLIRSSFVCAPGGSALPFIRSSFACGPGGAALPSIRSSFACAPGGSALPFTSTPCPLLFP